MKYLLSFILIWSGICLFAQNNDAVIKGNVSFISSQNVYVQFVNTDGIHIGDTLYISKNNVLKPALVVKSMSSISCVGNPFSEDLLAVSNQIFAKKKIESLPIDVLAQKSKTGISVNDMAIASSIKKTNFTAKLDGRVSLSSYINNTSDTTYNTINRFNLAIDAHHIGNSRLSAECYMTLTNKNIYRPMTRSKVDTLTNDTTNSLVNVSQTTNELLIYNLALKYDLDSTTCLTFGRKINNNLANIGAVDGLQFEKTGRNFSFGAVIGSRPDTYTYNINPGLLQFGAFVGFHTKNENRTTQTSIALFNQMNNMATDRRFIYFQHSNSLLKNLVFFCSLEVDLYGAKNQTDSAKTQNISGADSTVFWNNRTPVNIIELTSAYVSLNYRPFRNLSMSMSYDARKNVYYYQTYKSYVDSLLDKETRQGFRFQTSYRPFKRLAWGGNLGYRFPSTNTATKTSTSASKNGYTYLTYSQLPLIGASMTVDITAMKTPYFKSAMIYGGSLSRDFWNGNIFTELSYHCVDFTYITSTVLKENIAELSLSWRIAKKLFLSADFELTQEIGGSLQKRAFLNISQRF